MWVYWILKSHGRSTLRRGNARGRRAEPSSRGTVTGVGRGFSSEVRSQDRPTSALFKYLKKAHRWVDRFCGLQGIGVESDALRRNISTEPEEEFLQMSELPSHLRLLWKAGVARCWRRPNKGFWHLAESPNTVTLCDGSGTLFYGVAATGSPGCHAK